jgi:hypothetical protein
LKYGTSVLAGVILLSSGFLIYYYWSDISSIFKKGEGRPDNSSSGTSLSSASIPSNPSVHHDDSSYYQYFRRPWGLLKKPWNSLRKWNSK